MGYACPVCETPQADGRHLANHLAFTALIHGTGDAHEAWLTEHAPGWEETGERELAGRVIENATEIEFPRPVDDASARTTDAHDGRRAEPHDHDNDYDHNHNHAHRHDRGPKPAISDRRIGTDRGPMADIVDADPESETERTDDERSVEAVLAEARELTEQMNGENKPENDSAENNGNDGNDESDPDDEH